MRVSGLWLAVAACSRGGKDATPVDGPADAVAHTGAGTSPTTEPVHTGGEPPPADLAALAVPPAGSVANGRFSTADACATCHANAPAATAMRDAAGRDVAPWNLWQSAMMANSGRDPVWRTQVAAEVARTPAAAAAIEAKCLKCHAPMATVDAALAGDPPIGMALLTEASARGDLARDGVSCTACHQIEDVDLGAEPSFSGGYTIAAAGRIYGPHAAPFEMPMVMHSGFTPTPAAHVRTSGLCATCHTLEAHALGDDGRPTGGGVTEQAPFLEAAASAFASTTCQDCHLPLVDADGAPIATAIARNPMGTDFPPIGPRTPYGRHLLVGGNTLGPRLFRAFRSTLNPGADDAALVATELAAREQLGRAATVAITDAHRDGGVLRADVRVSPATGHKLPTGIPVRRVWLGVEVRDASGAVVAAIGAVDGRGRLVGEDGAPLPSERAGGPVAPHRDVVVDAASVAVWEGILADAAGDPTWILTRAEGWVKDDRLLPAGFDPVAGARVGPVGTSGDPDFGAGGDTVHLALDASGLPAGPLTVDATVWFQPLSGRWAEELRASGTPEAAALGAMLDAVGNPPERMATARATAE